MNHPSHADRSLTVHTPAPTERVLRATPTGRLSVDRPKRLRPRRKPRP